MKLVNAFKVINNTDLSNKIYNKLGGYVRESNLKLLYLLCYSNFMVLV